MFNNKKISEEYPQWLINNVFIDLFDWEQVKYSSFEALLKIITLHDSHWIGIFNYLDNSTNLIVNLDFIWNKSLIIHKDKKEIKEWPYLIIKLEKVYNIIFDSDIDCGATIADVKTEIISDSDKDIFINNFENQKIINSKLVENLIDYKVVKTRIEDVCNGFIEILHDEMIKVLIFDTEGRGIEVYGKN